MSDALDRVRERRRLEESGASTAELEAFDAAQHGDPIDTGRATSRDRRDLRARARRDEAPTHEAYKAGQREGRASRPAAPRRKARSSTSPVTLVEPGVAQATSGMKVLGMALWTVALYLVLQSAPQLTGFLGGAAKSISWLQSPTATIPRKSEVGSGLQQGVADANKAIGKALGTTSATVTTPTTKPGSPVLTA